MMRMIGSYEGMEDGPLMIVLGGTHGNELAGPRALELLFKMLEVEPITNPGFTFKGRLIGLRGNLQALKTGQRYVKEDLNRMFSEERVKKIRHKVRQILEAEEKELFELTNTIESLVHTHQPSQLIILDIHTTTAEGGIFCIASDDPVSIELGKQIKAPVITGMLKGIHGTTMHYYHRHRFPFPTTCIAFEAGQHDDPMSVNCSIAAIIDCMRAVGMVAPDDVEHRHDELLREYSRNLPDVARLKYAHSIRPEDQFVMRPGFKNFQAVPKGTLLANDRNGPILASQDALMLMPLYQKQGSDGFFLIETVI